MPAANLPKEGLREGALREAVTEYRAIISAVRDALEKLLCTGAPNAPSWIDLDAIYPDSAVVCVNGKNWMYAYSMAEDGTVTVNPEPTLVVEQYVPAVDAPANAKLETEDGAMIEALAGEGRPAGTVWRVWVIREGLSGNGVNYSAGFLREAAPQFEGTRVFEKADAQHLKGEGKDTKNLIGQIRNARFVEASGLAKGGVQADMHLLEASGLPAKLAEMQARGMLGLVGLSIDANGTYLPKGTFREALSITKVRSLDLIVEAGAGGEIIDLIEAAGYSDMTLREKMIAAIQAKHGGQLPADFNPQDDTALEMAYREALRDSPAPANHAPNADTLALQKRLDLMDMREAVNESGLPDAFKAKLRAKIDQGTTLDNLRLSIAAFRESLAEFSQSGHVTGLGDFSRRVETGEGWGDKQRQRLDDFFSRDKGQKISFKEAYIDITGDRDITGHFSRIDKQKMREVAAAYVAFREAQAGNKDAAIVAADFRESMDTSTFATTILGDSITRAMIAEYRIADGWEDWRWLVAGTTRINDFRTNERTRMGGYGDLPGISQSDPYVDLSTPGAAKETYAITKRGGVEKITMEMIANDDQGVIRRIPIKLAKAAKRTLYKFVFGLIDANPTLGDGTALFHASRSNLGSTALSSSAYFAARLAMFKLTELTSGQRLGVMPGHMAIPAELEETAYNIFKLQANQFEPQFVQANSVPYHKVMHWTDANDWYLFADPSEVPLIEVGFYLGNEEPELFTQDLPNAGSLFTNDEILYKIRHIYGGSVLSPDGMYASLVP